MVWEDVRKRSRGQLALVCAAARWRCSDSDTVLWICQQGVQPASWGQVCCQAVTRRVLLLFQVTAVVLVLMLGGATTLRDKWRPTKADTEQADIGAPAVTGDYRVQCPADLYTVCTMCAACECASPRSPLRDSWAFGFVRQAESLTYFTRLLDRHHSSSSACTALLQGRQPRGT